MADSSTADAFRIKQLELAGAARELADNSLTKPALAKSLRNLAEQLENDD